MSDEKQELSRWGLRQCAGYAGGGAVFAMGFWALSEMREVQEGDDTFGLLAYAIPAGLSIALAAIALLVAHYGRAWPSWLLTSISVAIFLLVLLGVVFTVLLFGLD